MIERIIESEIYDGKEYYHSQLLRDRRSFSDDHELRCLLPEWYGIYVNLCFSHSWKKVETLVHKFNYLLQIRKPGVRHFSVGKNKNRR